MESVLVMVRAVLLIMRNQLLGLLLLLHHIVINVVNEANSVRSMSELEVEALTMLFVDNTDALFLRIALENQLLEEQERSFVIDILANLHLTLPQMGRVRTLAVIALQIHDDEFDDERLLQQSAIHDFPLHGELHLETTRVGLRPDEACVDHLDALQSLRVLQADGQQLRRLELASRPWRCTIPVTLAAVLQLHSLADALRDVDPRLEALHASVRRCRSHERATQAASTTSKIVNIERRENNGE